MGVPQLDRFAAQRRRAWAGRMLSVNRLGGFCLLTRREVLDRVGGLDEQFGTEPFADGDLCLRVREAGLRVLLAQDVFVHRASAPDAADEARRQADQDYDLFQAKWGEESATAFRPAPETADKKPGDESAEDASRAVAPAPSAVLTVDPAKKGVTLCMIVRNEEANLPDCLRTVAGLFDEIVVVDTGSTDGTRAAALHFGAKVFEFPWVDSFAAARNESVAHASCKWIMWLDADDRLDEENRARLRAVFAALGDELDAYAIQVRSVLDAERTAYRLLDQVRLFRNAPEIRWDYRIHEQILPAVNRAGGVVRWTDAIVDHVGYQDVNVRRRKLERNLRLLEMDNAERPDDAFGLFNLGWTMLDLGRTADALPHLRHSLETAKPDSSILRKLHHLLAAGPAPDSERPEEALQACREGLKRFPGRRGTASGGGLDVAGPGRLGRRGTPLVPPLRAAAREVFFQRGGGAARLPHPPSALAGESFSSGKTAGWKRSFNGGRRWRNASTLNRLRQGLARCSIFALARWPDLEELLQKLDHEQG